MTDGLIDRISLQEGNMPDIKIMSKDETLFLLDRHHALESSVRGLEQNTGQEIQMTQNAVVNRLEKIEEIIEIDDKEKANFNLIGM